VYRQVLIGGELEERSKKRADREKSIKGGGSPHWTAVPSMEKEKKKILNEIFHGFSEPQPESDELLPERRPRSFVSPTSLPFHSSQSFYLTKCT
jgi:hypothetical protein